jgi:hypothetical protein
MTGPLAEGGTHPVAVLFNFQGGFMNRTQEIRAVMPAILMAAAMGAYSFGAIAADQVDNPPRSNTSKPETPPAHQDTSQASSSESSMSSMSNNMHEMPATVTAVDHKTGIVSVESEKMNLKVHFPTTAIADLKKGDKIKLQLGYSKE